MNTQDTSFYTASVMAQRKEQALKAAISYYFNGQHWSEAELECHAGINVDKDGTETFFIGDKPLVRFAPLQSKTDVENGRVICLFNQDIEALYQ